MKAHARFFFLILISILTVFAVGIASAEADGAKPFSTDYEAINEAAQSMFLVEIYGANDTLLGTGSGFIAFDEHYFVTNHHVIEDAKYLIVVDDNGKENKVTDLLVADEEKDIAILSFDEAANYRPLPLCATDDLLRGQPIVAIGSPKGVRNTVTTGNISNLIDDNGTHIIQFTAAASPGSSGGAIFNDRGEVIGLIFSKRNDAENMNYAISIQEIKSMEYTNVSHMSLSEYNISPDDVILLKVLFMEHNWETKLYDLDISIRNNDETRWVKSFQLSYCFGSSIIGGIVWKQNYNIDVPPHRTISVTIPIGHYNSYLNKKQILLGVNNIVLSDGKVIQCEKNDVIYHLHTIEVSESWYEFKEWLEQLESRNK